MRRVACSWLCRQRGFGDHNYSMEGSVMTEEQEEALWQEIAVEEHRWLYVQRFRALKALWLKPVVDRVRRDGVVEHRDGRGDDWTVWRAIKATIGVAFDLQHSCDEYRGSMDMAFWDSVSVYGGWESTCLSLYPGCKIRIYTDGDTWM